MLIQTESGEYDDGTIDDAGFLNLINQNIADPNAVANIAKQYNYGLKDVTRATGFGEADILGYFNQAKVTPWWATPAAPPATPTGGITNVATTPTPPPGGIAGESAEDRFLQSQADAQAANIAANNADPGYNYAKLVSDSI